MGEGRVAGWVGCMCIASGFIIGAGASAQERATVHAGDRLRVQSGEPIRTIMGRLVWVDSRRVTLDVPGRGRTDVPAGSIDRVERTRGPHPMLVYGAPIVGALVGGLVGSTMGLPERCRAAGETDYDCSREVPASVVGALWGGMALGLVGRLVARERWAELDLDFLTTAERPTIRSR